ncbi:MAG: hypothetical protein HDR54_04940 [Treponema sp.]|nr:hypothetical protein [Treponema sp.]MBD5408723.1 hypothetical protein [Treponema sp.]MBD5413802.1 hypothetical protein [Treponema sp.]MBD5442532.1 hypothetical protein [Treponema sp.]MDE6244809.1 hypothetical protein [Treponemataceae bacterium]
MAKAVQVQVLFAAEKTAEFFSGLFFSKNHFFPKVTFYPSDILNITATGG